MRANLKTGLCYCGHCLNGPPWLGRAREKREWMSEVQEALNENNKEGRIMIHRVNGTTPVPVPEVEPGYYGPPEDQLVAELSRRVPTLDPSHPAFRALINNIKCGFTSFIPPNVTPPTVWEKPDLEKAVASEIGTTLITEPLTLAEALDLLPGWLELEVAQLRLYIDGSPIPLDEIEDWVSIDEVWSLQDENGAVVGVWFE